MTAEGVWTVESPAESISIVESAAAAFDDIISQVEDPAAPGGGTYRGGRPDPTATRFEAQRRLQIRTRLARSVDQYSELFESAMSSFADVVDDALTPSTDRAGEGPSPVVAHGQPGTAAVAHVWAHNTSGARTPGFALTMTDLTAADGARVPAGAGSFDPSYLEEATVSRRAALLTINLPIELKSGTYYGHVLAVGLADVAIPIRLVVAR